MCSLGVIRYKRKCVTVASALLLLIPVSWVRAADSPLTPEIQQHLKSKVVTLIAEMFLKPGGLEKAKKARLAYATECRREPGCIQYQIHEDVTDPGHLFFYEQYADAQAFSDHVNSKHVKEWGDMLTPYYTTPLVVHFLNKMEHAE
jgi:quinol monooxygenase YgiN